MPLLSKDQMYSSGNKPRTVEIIHTFGGPLSLSKLGTPGKINLFKLYLEFAVDDPSEMAFCDAVFGDIYFWSVFREAPQFREHLAEWRVLATEKRKQQAFQIIVNEVKTNGKNALAAAKYLIEEPWKLQTPVTRKRKEIEKEISHTASLAQDSFKADIERLKQDGVLN